MLAKSFLAILLGLLALWALESRAETVMCTEIASVPYTIATAGKYCLNRDLIMRGADAAAIRIEANGVELDCNGHQLTYYSTSSASYGIYVRSRRLVTVRDCALHRFKTGIALSRVSSSRLLDNRVSYPENEGFYVSGDDIEIARNTIHVDYGSQTSGPSVGILTQPYWTGLPARMRITENVVQGESGILVLGGDLAIIEHNQVEGGIQIAEYWDIPQLPIPSRGLVRGNTVRGNIQVQQGSVVVCSENYIFASGSGSAISGCLTDTRENTVILN